MDHNEYEGYGAFEEDHRRFGAEKRFSLKLRRRAQAAIIAIAMFALSGFVYLALAHGDLLDVQYVAFEVD